MVDALREMVERRYCSPPEVEKYGKRAKQGLLSWEDTVVSRYFNKPSTILDVGCGGGREAFALHDMGHEVVGIDISEALLDRARAAARISGRAVEFKKCEGVALGFPDMHFDHVIVWAQVFGNVPSRDGRVSLASECARVLRGGGTLSFSVHNRHICERIVRDKGMVVEDPGVALEDGDFVLHDLQNADCYWHYFTRSEVTALCELAGLKVLDCGLAKDFGQADWDTLWICTARHEI